MPDTAPATLRQLHLAYRSTLVRTVDLIMSSLQVALPRREYPMNGSDRYGEVGVPWRRGGTSPGAVSMAGPPEGGQMPAGAYGGNYFLGAAEAKVESVGPWRVVWVPPQSGIRFVPAQQAGFLVPEAPDPGAAPALSPYSSEHLRSGPYQADSVGAASLHQVAGPAAQLAATTVRQGGSQRQMAAPFVVATCRTMVVPLTAWLWCNDFDDAQELLQWLCTCSEAVLQGTASGAGIGVCESAGFSPRDEKGTRGISAYLTINVPIPVIWPPMLGAEMTGFGVVLSPGAALTDVSGQ